MKDKIRQYIADIFNKHNYYYEYTLSKELIELLGITEEEEQEYDYNFIEVLGEFNIHEIHDDTEYCNEYIFTKKKYDDYYDFLIDNNFSKQEIESYKQRVIEKHPVYAMSKFNLSKDYNFMRQYLTSTDSYHDYTKIIDFELTQENIRELISDIEYNIDTMMYKFLFSSYTILLTLRTSPTINSILEIYGFNNSFENEILQRYANITLQHNYKTKKIEDQEIDYFMTDVAKVLNKKKIKILEHSQGNYKELPYIKVDKENTLELMHIINNNQFDLFPIVIKSEQQYLTYKSAVYLINRNIRIDALVYDDRNAEFILFEKIWQKYQLHKYNLQWVC